MRQEKAWKGLYLLADTAFKSIYGPEEQQDIAALVEIPAPQTTASIVENAFLLANVDVIFSGWGGPRLDSAFLKAAPCLKAFFYGAGATGGLISPEAWERGVVVTSAAAMNAIPVAEFTVAATIFALKQAFRSMREIGRCGAYPARNTPIPGAYGTTVGLVSLGAIGRAVRERLRMLDVSVIAYDPFLSEEDARLLEVEMASLEEVFRRSDVVSVHTPLLPETERMITGAHLLSMKAGAALINTARGAVIAEDQMIRALMERPDLTAVLDVVHPEPPVSGSPLYTLPNLFLTPHIAGAMDAECRRMGRFMVEELRRFHRGERLLGEVRPERAQHTIHRPH